MRKLLVVIALISSGMLLQAQVELKGVELGSKYEGGEDVIETTLGGVAGIIFVNTINDGRSYMLGFIPSDDGENINRISYIDVERLKNGIEKKYSIKFKKVDKDSYSDDYTLNAKKDGVIYNCIVEENKYKNPSYSFSFVIRNSELYKINEKEEQDRANKDF